MTKARPDHHHSQGLGMASAAVRKRLMAELRRAGIDDERVLKAMETVPRHEFLEEAWRSRAYENNALPIGLAQTISQPYIVALMTQALLRDGVPRRVLEIGTGSGYQTAVLAEVVPSVFSVERLKHLSEQARRRLASLGYHNVIFSYGDGGIGLASYAPFDGIVVTAAAEQVPSALVEQLAVGGRMVIPVGPPNFQVLQLIRRQPGGLVTERLCDVSFVPLLPGRA